MVDLARVSRRTVLKYFSAIGIGTLFSGLLGKRMVETALSAAAKPAEPAPTQPGELLYPYPPAVPGAHFVMMIDVGACIGCRRCLYGCKMENNEPDEPSNIHWISLFELDNSQPVTEVDTIPPRSNIQGYTSSPTPGKWYLSFNCFHCDNPPCTKVCPTGATYKSADGLVLIDYEKCIGCRYCVSACPYNARSFNWWPPIYKPSRVNPITGQQEPLNPKVPLRYKGVNEKCTFCVHRIRAGNPVPRCVEVCPVRARHFGDANDPNSDVSRLLVDVKTNRIREDLNTQPQLYYFTRGVKWTKDGEKI